jgi:hypothetical protein
MALIAWDNSEPPPHTGFQVVEVTPNIVVRPLITLTTNHSSVRTGGW